jgi:hypothetical protein
MHLLLFFGNARTAEDRRFLSEFTHNIFKNTYENPQNAEKTGKKKSIFCVQSRQNGVKLFYIQ